MSWPMLLIEKHYPWQYPRGTKKERDFQIWGWRRADFTKLENLIFNSRTA
jgi:hypothetical protein